VSVVAAATAGRLAQPVMNESVGPQSMTSQVPGGFMSPSTVAMVGSSPDSMRHSTASRISSARPP